MDLWKNIEVTFVALTDATLFAAHKNNVTKVKRILMDLLKDHLTPHIAGK